MDLTWSMVLGVLSAAVLILTFVEKARQALGIKQKREVSFAEDLATKKDLAGQANAQAAALSELKEAVEREKTIGADRRQKIHERIERVSTETSTQIAQFRREVKEDINGVHGRVSDLVECVGEMRGEIKQALKK